MSESVFELKGGEGPFVAMAIHDGHALREEVGSALVLSQADRLREEDPFTGLWTRVAPNRVVGLRSRFEFDLNRPRERAVYRRPADAWGLDLWRQEPAEEMVQRSLALYDEFYAMLEELLSRLTERYPRLLVLDLHSYNHRRQGPQAPPDDPETRPEINIGTGTMTDRERWAHVIQSFSRGLTSKPVAGRTLDVRENVCFRGGNCARWIHQRFPEQVCVLSVEVKKFFMDEWSGALDEQVHAQVECALRFGLEEVRNTWERG